MLCVHGGLKCGLILILTGFWLSSFAPPAAYAQDAPVFEITLKGQTFTPAELKVPAGTAFTIKVKNENDAPAEFESHDLKIEKIVSGHSEIIVKVKPLPDGTFEFVDEYHEDVARGTVVSE